MALAGRDAEQEALGAAVAAVQEGGSRVLVVVGEAGIGKSALLGAAAAQAAKAGLRVVSSRAAEHEQDVPFGLVIDAFDDIVEQMNPSRREALGPDLGAVLPAAGDAAALDGGGGAAERFRLHRAVRGLVEQLGREKPLAILLDDVHWADPASTECLLHLLHRPPRVPCLLVIALRPVDAALRVLDIARTVPERDRLVLGPLDRAAALALAAGVTDEATRERVLADAAGNPLFLTELVRAAPQPGDALPPTLMAAVGRERDQLDPAAQALVDGAAVVGDPFDPELAAVAADRDGEGLDALDALVAADLVRPGSGGRLFAFRHPLVRQAVYEATPPAWRLGAHERVAAALDARGAPATARAYHVALSARPGDEAALAVLEEAAGESAVRSPQAAAHWLQAALRLLPAGDLERRAHLLGPLAAAQAASGHLEEARTALLEALAVRPDDIALVVQCAGVERVLGRHGEAVPRLLAALTRAREADRTGLTLELAICLYFIGDARRLLPYALQAGEMAQGAERVSAFALIALARRWHDQPQEAETALDVAAATMAALTDDEAAVRVEAPMLLGVAELLSERFVAARATLDHGIALARRTGRDGMLPMMRFVRGMVHRNLLDMDTALADLEAAEESARLLGLSDVENWTLASLAMTHFERGEPAETAAAVARHERQPGEIAPTLAASNGRCNIAATWVDQDPERCIAEMVRYGGAELEHADPSWSTFLLRTLVRASIARGALDDAERWAGLVERRAAARRLPAGATRAATARGDVLLARGDAAGAVARAREAIALGERADARYDAVDARLLLGRALAASGEREQAIEELQAVVAEAGAARAMRLRDGAAGALRSLGVRVSAAARRAGETHADLTDREQEIAELVARGHTNREVAATLFLSEKTIEYHLSRVYGKLGVRSRTELAGVFAPR